MGGLADFRAKHPEYNDMDDGALGNALHAKFYSDMPKADFDAKMGIAPAAAPRWDVMGDIGRAAEGAAGAVKQDFNSAFPDPLKMDVGPVASIKRMGSALKVPLDALGVVAAPVTGLAHALGGSALSYAIPTPGKDMDIAGEHFYSDPKEAGDQVIDQMMLGLGPRGMGAPEGLVASAETAQAANAARKSAILKNKAAKTVSERAAADGLTPDQIAQAQAQASAGGDKMTLMDLGDKNVRGLAGAVHRAPGPAGKHIDEFLETRDATATPALTKDVQGSVAKGSTYNAVQDLIKARSEAAGPAYKDALASTSVAPFESQFRDALVSITGKKGHIAKQLRDIEDTNSGALAARGAAGADVRAKYMDLHEQLQQIEADRASAQEMFKRAQTDKTANAPGAVWSPRLQQFLDHPEVQSGLKSGLKMEMQDAIAKNRPFKPSDYSIVGKDEAGDPIVGTVPTMKSLAVAKEGLDAKILDMVDDRTGRPTKAGLSLKGFRDAFVDELDTLNPKYKPARDAWSGPSQTMGAVREGKQHFTRPESNDEIRAEFEKLSASDKEFYRLGAAESKIDQLERAPDASDKSKRIINSERDRKRFRMLFANDAEADKFINSVARKRSMFETKNAVKGNSATAGRLAEDDHLGATAAFHGAHGAMNAAGGNWLGAARSLYNAKRDLGMRNNPDLNSEIARLLTSHDLPLVSDNTGRILPPVNVPKKQGSVGSAALLDLLMNSAPSPRNKH